MHSTFSELQMNADEVGTYISDIFPQSQLGKSTYMIEKVALNNVCLKLSPSERHLRPGGTVSGPAMMTLVDISAYVLLLAHYGPVALAVTTNLTIDFLNKPNFDDIFCHSHFIKSGKRLVVTRHEITDKHERLLAHSTATYSIPPAR